MAWYPQLGRCHLHDGCRRHCSCCLHRQRQSPQHPRYQLPRHLQLVACLWSFQVTRFDHRLDFISRHLRGWACSLSLGPIHHRWQRKPGPISLLRCYLQHPTRCCKLTTYSSNLLIIRCTIELNHILSTTQLLPFVRRIRQCRFH